MSEKTIAQRLLLKPNQKIFLLNAPKGYAESMGDLPDGTSVTKKAEHVDLIQLFVANKAELKTHLPKLKTALTPKGALWVCYHKSTSKTKTDINRDTIAAYAESIGLSAYRMISINADWSALALKLV